MHLCLDSGIFTCLTPGYYAVSFSAYSSLGLNTNGNTFGPNYLYLFKNNEQVPESGWELFRNDALNAYVGLTASRNLVSHLFGRFSLLSLYQMLHLDAGDTLDLRMTEGNWVRSITLNIELIGLGFH